MLNLDPTYLMLSILFSGIGLGYFMYGKKRPNPLCLVVGITLMAYPYFIRGSLSMILTGVALMSVPWLVAKMRGY